MPPWRLAEASAFDTLRCMITARKLRVVDDDPSNLEIATATLTLAGYEVVSCDNGQHALTYLIEGQECFDAVLSDVLMPLGIDGRKVAMHIRQHPSIRDLPIICVSALTGPAAVLAGLEAGCDVCLNKPFKRSGLLAALAEAFAKRPPRQAGE